MFIGRDRELALLQELSSKRLASLVVCKGRRRVGKSRLIQEFGANKKRFVQFQGLPPSEGVDDTTQLKNIAEQFAIQFKLPSSMEFNNWTEAFSLLANQTSKGEVLIFLDEISWMASDSKDFVGKLKIAWDTLFKKNPNLILVICGSVSSWIDENILKNAGFVGRVSLTLEIEPLELQYCSSFWGTRKDRVSYIEKLKLLSVVGGIPRYLEEIQPKLSAEENIKKMCFSKEGILFEEFDKIFGDTYGKRADTYKEIVRALVNGRQSFSDICESLNKEEGGGYSKYLDDLIQSGFLERDYSWKLNSQRSNVNLYRLKDNYIRFYLKYIDPKRDQIKKGLFEFKSLESLPEWNSILGLQFENLILSNISELTRKLNLPINSVVSASPYFQNKTKNQSACQVDLMINTKNSLYFCEIKFRKKIETTVIKEMQEKISKIKIPPNTSFRPVLIYAGELSPGILEEDYFDRVLNVEEMLG